MTWFFDLAAAFFIAVNIQNRRKQLLGALLAGCAISLASDYIASILQFSFVDLAPSSSAEAMGMKIGGMIGNSFIVVFAMWLFRKSE